MIPHQPHAPSSRLVGLLVLLLLAACATSGEREGSASRSANVLTAEEITAARSSQHAFDLIRMLRPAWLQPRGVTSLGSPVEQRPGERQVTQSIAVQVYLDGSRAGDVSVLRSILASDILSARFLSATEATSQLGTGHSGGAIMITTRRF